MSQPPVVIGVAGGSGSGKSTGSSVALPRASVLNASPFSNTIATTTTARNCASKNVRSWYDHPDSLETDLLVEHVRLLARGESVEVPNYDFTMHARRTTTERVEPRQAIIVEGILIYTRTRHCAT
ncbi:MAG: hypothetical protein U0Q11_16180 [Vicinamibacterales bacterium]